MGTRSVLCRYYLHGACTRGAACPFSHDMADAESQVRLGWGWGCVPPMMLQIGSWG